MPPLTPDQAQHIQPGAMLHPLGVWNATERRRKLAQPTQVLAVRHGVRSQTGVAFQVADSTGAEHWLDAGWFHAPEPAPGPGP